jgi:putative transposase
VGCHLEGSSNGVVDVEPLAERVADWNELLAEEVPSEELEKLRLHQRTGRPLGELVR